ncbi:membrane-associated proteins in eicosanoid and glutathione metabolism [Calocera viscosa TUFC12733]|uniref:Membrane-associated proteins in eicosanoid and glutathione metabolism n=1 Tax=Calocera viscosa (strain TUFC12733) TaxID=1330018 RepID=A0A167NU12_CALVF|nr:membrane-associated proteins in eicosanoid and glutathione metabolism [Calocera viscosa TUFC12733]
MPVELPEQYPWVIATATSAVFLNIYQYSNVEHARRAAGVKYPQLYAEKAEMDNNALALKFNCAQRAHQNTLESVPYVLLMHVSFVGGLKYPVTTTGLLGTWILARVGYTYQYSQGDPTKRGGPLTGIALAGLIIVSVGAAGRLVYAMRR